MAPNRPAWPNTRWGADCVGRVLGAHSLPPSAALVVVDDIALPFGALRMRLRGSAGGNPHDHC